MSKRILVVEDQPDNRQIIRDMRAGTDYEVTEAEDGEQALAAVAKERPDLTTTPNGRAQGRPCATTSYAPSSRDNVTRAGLRGFSVPKEALIADS